MKVLDHLQCSETQIDAVQEGDEVADHQKRHDTQSHAPHGGFFELHRIWIVLEFRVIKSPQRRRGAEEIMRIIGIDHVVIRCIDIKRMLPFYCDVLGCSLEKAREDLGLYHLRAGKSLIDLLSISESAPDASARNMDHLCLRIDTFDETALRAHFRAAGIELGEVHNNFGADGDGPSFYLNDPEGNTIELKGPPFV